MKIWLFLIVATLGLASCSKYENGGMSLKTKKERVTNKWKLKSAWINGYEALNHVADDIYEITKEGNVTMIQFDQTVLHGSWEFTEEKENILIRAFEGQTSSVWYTQEWEILRLKKDELWIRTLFEGDEYEYHFDVM